MELQIQEFQNSIIKLINEQGLPLSLVHYILRDILSDIDSLRNEELQNNKMEAAKQETPSQDGDEPIFEI